MSRPLNGVERKQQESRELSQRASEAAAAGQLSVARALSAQSELARKQASWMSE